MSESTKTIMALILAIFIPSMGGLAAAPPMTYQAPHLEGPTVGHVVHLRVTDASSLGWIFCDNIEQGQYESGSALFVYVIEGGELRPHFLVSGGHEGSTLLNTRVAINALPEAPITYEFHRDDLVTSASCVAIYQPLPDGAGDFVAVAAYYNGSSSGRMFEVRADGALASRTLDALWQHTTSEAHFKFGRDLRAGMEASALQGQALALAEMAFQSTDTAVYGSFGFDSSASYSVGAYWLDMPNGERHLGCPLHGAPKCLSCERTKGLVPELFVGPSGDYRLTLIASAEAEPSSSFRGIWVNAPLPPGVSIP